MIVPARVVVPDDDFASAFADLEAIELVASVPSLGLDPRCEFCLSGWIVKAERHGRATNRH